jgi:cob(I)alamin adenosyltransferase
MVTLNRIYTRTGDDGTTGLVGGTRTSKTAPRVCAYGDIDELNCHVGMCVTIATDSSVEAIRSKLTLIQNELFDIGSELATAPGESWPGAILASAAQASRLEQWIDELNADLPPLTSFVLPGGCPLNAQLHISRAVCRRAERSVLTLNESEPVSEHITRYLNRLSDLLFVMSRFASKSLGVQEYLWSPGASAPKAG